MGRELLKTSNILIVDDNQNNIEVLEELLELEGYENVTSITDSRDTIQKFKETDPDLVLLDLMMPYLDGFEIMRLLRNNLSEGAIVPILVLTADASDESKKKALNAGATDFLAKPFDLNEVILRVRNLLQISSLNKQLRQQNTILEEKVKERTEELEQQNIELKVAWQKAEASNRLKTAFINNISHEIRTPLNGIVGFSQMISERDLPEENKKEIIQSINESSERLINTVTAFMDISLIHSGNMEKVIAEVSPDLLVNEAVERFRPLATKKNLTISETTEITDEFNFIQSDEVMLQKILFYLTDNAIKFTKEGAIELGYTLQNENVQFYIKDTGVGISEHGKKEIFESFAQENFGFNREHEGNGLGLAIAKGLLDLLGGEIDFESKKDEGTTFYFSVPIEHNNESAKSINTDKNDLNGRVRNVLIVEDDYINYRLIESLLRNENIKLTHAKNGNEAISACEHENNFDAVLMDLKLPELDGFQATKAIKEKNKDLPIIAITAYSSAEDRLKALDAGCDEFIIKPIKKSILFQKLEKYHITVAKN